MLLPFGTLLTLIGIVVIFVTLLGIMVFTEIIKRFYEHRVKETLSNNYLAKVAAFSAVYHYISDEGRDYPNIKISDGESRWSTIAKLETLKILGDEY